MLLKKNLSSNDIALGGILVGINIILLSLVSVMPTLKAAMLFLTSIVTVITIMKSNIKVSFIVYFATTILATFIVVDKVYVIYYGMIFGLYPIIKYYLEKRNNLWIEYPFKIIFFNILLGISYYIIKTVFGFEFIIQINIVLIIGILQILFIIYDYILTKIITILYKNPIWKK